MRLVKASATRQGCDVLTAKFNCQLANVPLQTKPRFASSDGAGPARRVDDVCRLLGRSSACGQPGLVDPFHEYTHNTGFAITGGYVYRGCVIPDLQGDYFFADYVANRIWSGQYNGIGFSHFQERTVELAPS